MVVLYKTTQPMRACAMVFLQQCNSRPLFRDCLCKHFYKKCTVLVREKIRRYKNLKNMFMICVSKFTWIRHFLCALSMRDFLAVSENDVNCYSCLLHVPAWHFLMNLIQGLILMR